MAGKISRDQADHRSPILRGQQDELVGLDVLVLRRGPLLRLRKVDPQLHAVEKAALHHDLLGRHLRVHDARPGRHPLGRAVCNETSTAV